ncbi:hypothetical protein KY338_00495 [Candidatus Woesearchaeota archaeon]|nr:hypothetical protein [Candidatus Woesearchaeota archaeon]MBW3005202.1 hypothetical protein [Candidatus Woesearchaeota archaeon]
MKFKILFGLFIVLIFISGCAKDSITAKAIDDLPIEKKLDVEAKITSAEACMNVVCGSNSQCENGKCICNEGYKKCNGECILTQDCCTEDDCDSGESCRDHKCIPDNCKLNEVPDPAKRECVCDDNSKYCAMQKKCIPKENCCMHADCESDCRCVPTGRLAVLCIKSGKTQCKSVHPDRPESFFVAGVRYDVKINYFLQDNGIDIDVNDINHVFTADAVEKIGDNVNIYIDTVDDIGGHCKKDN